MYLDQYGLIVTQNQDGGDSCAETARYFFLYWFNFVFMSNYHIALKLPQMKLPSELLNLLEIEPGIYIRNPDKTKWWSDQHQTSRDQLQPVIWYCAAYRDYHRLFRLFSAIMKRGGFAQNDQKKGSWKLPDQMWTCLGHFIRAGGYYTAVLYPLLFLFDFLDLLGILFWLFLVPNDNAVWNKPQTWLAKRSPNDVDDNNTDCDLLAAVAFKPTPISWLTRLIWRACRPKNLGNTELSISNNCLAAITWYHSPQNGGNTEVTELYKQPILTYMRGIK